MSYAPDCADCPTPAECKAANDCAVMRQIRHPVTIPPVPSCIFRSGCKSVLKCANQQRCCGGDSSDIQE